MKMTTLKEPVAGYDKLNTKEVVASLSSHSQVELAKIESYERHHDERVPVIDKLRFMRQDEPLPATTRSASTRSWPRWTRRTSRP